MLVPVPGSCKTKELVAVIVVPVSAAGVLDPLPQAISPLLSVSKDVQLANVESVKFPVIIASPSLSILKMSVPLSCIERSLPFVTVLTGLISSVASSVLLVCGLCVKVVCAAYVCEPLQF